MRREMDRSISKGLNMIIFIKVWVKVDGWDRGETFKVGSLLEHLKKSVLEKRKKVL